MPGRRGRSSFAAHAGSPQTVFGPIQLVMVFLVQERRRTFGDENDRADVSTPRQCQRIGFAVQHRQPPTRAVIVIKLATFASIPTAGSARTLLLALASRDDRLRKQLQPQQGHGASIRAPSLPRQIAMSMRGSAQEQCNQNCDAWISQVRPPAIRDTRKTTASMHLDQALLGNKPGSFRRNDLALNHLPA